MPPTAQAAPPQANMNPDTGEVIAPPQPGVFLRGTILRRTHKKNTRKDGTPFEVITYTVIAGGQQYSYEEYDSPRELAYPTGTFIDLPVEVSAYNGFIRLRAPREDNF